MLPASAEFSGHRLCPSLGCVCSVGWPESRQFPLEGPPEFKEKETLPLNFIFHCCLVISSHSGFSSCLHPKADTVIPNHPQGIKDYLGKEERAELLKYAP